MSDSAGVSSDRESERVGLLVGGRYTLARRLGRGGMGSVWAANDESEKTQVALKILHQHKNGNREILSRFEREASTLGGIESRHVVKILGHGLDAAVGPYMALELLDGEDLGARLDRETTLPLRDVVQVVVQACRGLAKAHGVGIVHRDVKPENIFLEELRGKMFVKIVDFGVAKVVGDGRSLTAPGALLGTLEYMSPEQVMAKGPIDARADLYSLAVVAYRSLVGRPPFVGDQVGELILQLVSKKPEPPSTLDPTVPPDVDRWFARALSLEPEKRFQSAFEMAEALVTAWRAVTAKIEDFDAPLSLSPASMARIRVADSGPPASLDVIEVPPRESRRPAAEPRRPVAASQTPPPSSTGAPIPTERSAMGAPRPMVRQDSLPGEGGEQGAAWASGEAKMFALVASVLVFASIVFYAISG